MQYFAVHYTYVDDTDLITRHRPDHRAFLTGLTDRGLIAGGAYPEVAPPSALLIFRAESAEAVSTMLADDPFRIHGVLADAKVVPWTPVIGIFAELRIRAQGRSLASSIASSAALPGGKGS